MKNKRKTNITGPEYAGTPPVQHSHVVLAQQEESAEKKAPKEEKVLTEREKIKALNDDDIEADRHNGSGGAFEATEMEREED
jgi:hypothetical protein